MNLSRLTFPCLLIGALGVNRLVPLAQSSTDTTPVASAAASVADPSNLEALAGKKKVATDRVFVRGWEIVTASAIKRGSVTDVFPAFDQIQKKRSGNVQKPESSKRGQFLIVAVNSRWATGQPPNEPLWAGKPDVTLIDDVGFEYPAIDVVSKVGSDFVPASIGAIPAREKKGKEQSKNVRMLVYFDVPANGQNFWLKFSPNLPLLPVSQVTDLP